MSAVETDPLRDSEAEAIVRRLAETMSTPRVVIERIVAEELVRFQAAPVRNFVPILVERAVRRRLTGSQAATPIRPADPACSRRVP